MPRLDVVMVQMGLVPSRQRAKMLIQNGQIFVNGKAVTKPAFSVEAEDTVEMQGSDIPFVGRGGLKLEHALAVAKIDLHQKVCMDIGASTGGFTDCMLQYGAAKVYAIDVGHGQLAPELRLDARVENWEGTDIRHVTAAQVPDPVSFFSVDVSFISLRLVLPAATSFLAPDGMAAILIKPQFEAGRSHIGKNGLVLSKKAHQQVLADMLTLFASLGLSLQMLCPSPIRGGSGNVEYLAVVQKSERAPIVPDVTTLVTEALAGKS